MRSDRILSCLLKQSTRHDQTNYGRPIIFSFFNLYSFFDPKDFRSKELRSMPLLCSKKYSSDSKRIIKSKSFDIREKKQFILRKIQILFFTIFDCCHSYVAFLCNLINLFEISISKATLADMHVRDIK